VTGAKRILVLTPRWPYPPFGGDKLFISNVALALRGYRLTLLTMCNTRSEMEFEPTDGVFSEIHKVYLPRWRSMWNVLRSIPGKNPLQLAYYWSPAFREKYRSLLSQHDAVLAHLVRTGQYVENSAQGKPSALLMSDAISLAYQRMSRLRGASALWQLIYGIELRRMFQYEKTSPRSFDQIWLHSQVDQDFLGLNLEGLRIIPLGVDLGEFPFLASSGNTIAFIGNMFSSFNRDACRHFVRDIFPLLVRRRGEIRFRIIGACPPATKQEFERCPGVEVTGTVARIADSVTDVFCGVCSLRAGAGIQNKILNYLALGIPCVTSEIGLEGIRATHGQHLFAYKTAEEAADYILKLHNDCDLRAQMALRGRQFVEQFHDWTAIHQLVDATVSQLFEPETRPAPVLHDEEADFPAEVEEQPHVHSRR
jgi:glycosyltransferase involved in cell wall biosynthesis